MLKYKINGKRVPLPALECESNKLFTWLAYIFEMNELNKEFSNLSLFWNEPPKLVIVYNLRLIRDH